MKGNILLAAFAAFFTTPTYAHPRSSETVQVKVSIDVAEVTEDPLTYAVLFFEGANICLTGDSYTIKAPVNCLPFPIVEPTTEVQSVTLHGEANCTISTASLPPVEYDLVSFGIPPTVPIDPPAVFVSVDCCPPAEEDGNGKHRM